MNVIRRYNASEVGRLLRHEHRLGPNAASDVIWTAWPPLLRWCLGGAFR